jgi:hypothetical protein
MVRPDHAALSCEGSAIESDADLAIVTALLGGFSPERGASDITVLRFRIL